MYFKRTPISNLSDRGKLRKDIGEIHLKILRLKRGNVCEICGLPGPVGRFHILPVGAHLRLEFYDPNVLLAHWMQNCQAHYLWHHAGPADRRNIRTLNKIIELRGANYEQDFRAREFMIPKHDTLYLRALKETFEKELKSLQDT